MPGFRRLLVLVAVAGVVGVTAWRLAGARRVVVRGASMSPTLEPGDRLLVVRARRLRVGQLVAVPDPRRPSLLLVKRIAAVRGDMVELRGDNRRASTDSSVFGDVPERAVVGRAIRRYGPPRRRGPLG